MPLRIVVVVLGFNATLTAKFILWRSVMHMFPGFLTPVLTQLSFQSHQLLFLHTSAEVRGKNKPKRQFTLNRSQTHNNQVMGDASQEKNIFKTLREKKKMLVTRIFSFSNNFSILWYTNLVFWLTFNLLSVNTFSLDKVKILLSGKFGQLVVLGFHATLTAKVISWRLVTPMYLLSFSHQY